MLKVCCHVWTLEASNQHPEAKAVHKVGEKWCQLDIRGREAKE